MFRTAAEKSGANANLRGAFFDRDFEIVAHSHGKYRQGTAQRMADCVAKLAQPAKKRTYLFGVVKIGRDRHQPEQFQIFQRGNRSGKGKHILFLNAVLCRFVSEMDLDQNREVLSFLGCGCVKLLGESRAIDRIDTIEQVRRAPRLITLQMPDEVHRRIEARQSAALCFPLLKAVLAEMPEARGTGFADGIRRKGFRYRNESDFLSAASGSPRRVRDAFVDLLQICRDRNYRFSVECCGMPAEGLNSAAIFWLSRKATKHPCSRRSARLRPHPLDCAPR
jgi:hypothetical protein